MGEKSTCEAYGAIRLVPKLDGIGIPVFKHRSDNYLYVAETDENLAITRFLTFVDVEHYGVDSSCVGILPRRSFSIGDPVFLPYWRDGLPQLVAGDISLADFDALLPDQLDAGDILNDVREVVFNSRTGVYAERLMAVDFEIFRAEYGDIFIEEPSNTKYWVSRFRSAAMRVQGNPRFVNSVPNKQLRQRASEWLGLYFHKGEFRFALSMLEACTPSILNLAEVRFVLFLQLTERMVRDFGAKTPNVTYLDVAERYFPKGIYHYFTWESGSGNEVDTRLVEGVRSLERLDAADLLGFYRQQLRADLGTVDLKRLHAVTTVMFGMTDAPKDVSERINHLYFSRLDEVVRLLDLTFNRIVKREGDEQDWWVLATEATAAVRDLEILLRTFNPDLRFADPDISRLSIDHYQVRYLADVAKRLY